LFNPQTYFPADRIAGPAFSGTRLMKTALLNESAFLFSPNEGRWCQGKTRKKLFQAIFGTSVECSEFLLRRKEKGNA
jgi:hypothetical protein